MAHPRSSKRRKEESWLHVLTKGTVYAVAPLALAAGGTGATLMEVRAELVNRPRIVDVMPSSQPEPVADNLKKYLQGGISGEGARTFVVNDITPAELQGLLTIVAPLPQLHNGGSSPTAARTIIQTYSVRHALESSVSDETRFDARIVVSRTPVDRLSAPISKPEARASLISGLLRCASGETADLAPEILNLVGPLWEQACVESIGALRDPQWLRHLMAYQEPLLPLTTRFGFLVLPLTLCATRLDWPGRRKFREAIKESFSLGELRTVCFDLKVDYEDLPDTKEDMVRELINYMLRNDDIDRLVCEVYRRRPNIPWSDLLDLPPVERWFLKLLKIWPVIWGCLDKMDMDIIQLSDCTHEPKDYLSKIMNALMMVEPPAIYQREQFFSLMSA